MPSTTEKIRTIEAELGLHLDEIGERVGKHRTRVSEWKNQNKKPGSADTRARLDSLYQEALDAKAGQKTPVQQKRDRLLGALQSMSEDAIERLYPELMKYAAKDMAEQWGTEGGTLDRVLEEGEPQPTAGAVATRGKPPSPA